MAIVTKKSAKKADDTKSKAQAFLNWNALNKSGEVAIKSSKGFAIFDNDYTSKQEQQLVDLAKKNGGEIQLNMIVTVRLNEQTEAQDLDLDLFI